MDDIFAALLAEFEDAGLWRDGVELIGSWSFLLYQRHLGVRKFPVRTQDVDFLLPRPYPKRALIDIGARLQKLGFRSASASDGSTYFLHPDLKLEFIVPERGEGDSDSPRVQPLGIRAISLRFMDMLLRDSIVLKEAGAHVRVPKPLNFCLHKLIIAQRRKNKAKRPRDIEQAICTLDIIAPSDFKAGLAACPKGWRSLIEKSLQEALESLPLERAVLMRHGVAPQR